jgi:type I restriction enzyme S subunit
VSEGPWPIVSLGELIASIEAGASFRCRETPPEADEVGVAKVSAVSWGRYDENESKTCLNASRIDPSLLIQKGDFLISRANTVQLVGACVIAERVTKQVMLSDKTLRIQFTDQSLKPWVLQYLRSREGRSQIEALCTGNQESMRNISQKSIRQIQLPLAPAEERDRVIAYLDQQLSRLQASVEIFGIIQAKLKQARASILKAAVEGRLVEREGKWNAVPLQTLLREPMRNGKSAKTSPAGHGVRIATLTAATNQRFTEQNTKISTLNPDEVDGLWMEPGDLFVQRSNTPELVGSSVLYAGPEDWAIFPDLLIRLRCSEAILPKWMLFNLQAPEIRNSFKRQAQGTAGSMPKISQGVIAAATIQLPSVLKQTLIIAEVDRRFSVLDQVEATVTASLARCGVLRQAILKRAFGG